MATGVVQSAVELTSSAASVAKAPSPAGSAEEALLCFVNKKSGGGAGTRVYNSYVELLGAGNVVDLGVLSGNSELDATLAKYAGAPHFGARILACGGDGTGGWLLAAVDRVTHAAQQSAPDTKCSFSLAMMPLGTGNDMSRQFRWGTGFSRRMLSARWVERVRAAQKRPLDRWKVIVWPSKTDPGDQPPPVMTVHTEASHPTKGTIHKAVRRGNSFSGAGEEEHSKADGLEQPTGDPDFFTGTFTNYFSLGSDAKVANAFHVARDANPKAFKSQIGNQIYYARMGATVGGLFGCLPCCCPRTPPRLSADGVQLFVRTAASPPGDVGQAANRVEIPKGVRALAFLGLTNYGGGRNLWGRMPSTQWTKPSICDGVLDIVGFTSPVQMGCVMGCNYFRSAVRIAQGTEVKVEMPNRNFVQIDGEPWVQSSAIIEIICEPDKAQMLQG